MKMWSPNGDCHIALTTGHTFIVPGDRDGIEVQQRFHKEALSRGCLPVGMEPEPEADNSAPDRATVIQAKMRDMLNSDDPSYFTGDNKPKTDVLTKLCGFQVDRSERDRLWKAIEDDPDGLKA